MKTEKEIKEALDSYAILREILGNAEISINEDTISVVQETLHWVLEED